jgi:NAD(P)-dependent dehydrogenase (short-subunit alcohol dehydrogenase family)
MSTEQNTGRVAVITGASSGILQAVAEELGSGATAIEADDLVLITAPALALALAIGVGHPPRLAIGPVRRLGFFGCGGPAREEVHCLL